MAASDQTYRKQYALDIVFALSSVLMLVSVVMMFAQDYFRPYKKEQRAFRDVESGVSQRLALAALPKKDEFDKKKKALDDVLAKRKEKGSDGKDADQRVKDYKQEFDAIRPKKERSDAAYQTVKQNYDSIQSLIYLETDKGKKDTYEKQFASLKDQLRDAKAISDDYDEKSKVLQDKISQEQTPLLEAQADWKKINDRFETQAKLAIAKEWGWGDWFRGLPVIDGFGSPTKIHQITIDADVIGIDYNLSTVRRYDRCMTCHQGIDRPAYSKDMLRSLLKDIPEDQKKELEVAKARLKERRELLEKIDPKEAANVPDPRYLTVSKLSKDDLTESRIKEFCAHPRQDLFVGSNSKHPAEKFGCTSCHRGQGSGTTFNGSFHSPNDSAAQKDWLKDYSWGTDTHTFMWDYPMLPARFVESSCLKCHHQVTDLYSPNNRNEAPKVLKGYNLIRENGCFGCHEIQGRKEGRPVGPDMRLEPVPPLDDLSAKERHAIKSDMDNLPGEYRKVGPSLYRLTEKTNRDWALKWLKAPREFRPDTKMPHFYGLTNNDPKNLPAGQEKFPDAEMHAITHYLFSASESYLKQVAELHPKDQKEYHSLLQSEEKLLESLLNNPTAVPKEMLQEYLSEDVSKISALSPSMIKESTTRLRSKIQKRKAHTPLVDLPADDKGDPLKGRQLFSERGCMACHSHHATETPQGKAPVGEGSPGTYAPAMMGEAQFGPNLSQLKAKLGKSAGHLPSARVWLRHWINNPHMHSPRSRMPITHLTKEEVADVAEWLLTQEPSDLGKDWNSTAIAEPDPKDYENLARVYLKRLLPADYMEKFLKKEKLDENVIRDLPGDEQVLFKTKMETEDLKFYLGKKAVGRLGCYGCHDVPGFESSKPIGTGLMDWGKKKSDKLAFEDVARYIKEHYKAEPSLKDKDGKPLPALIDGKMPYEQFFIDAVGAHQREGYLNQKLLEPRSYDFNRNLAWDDRSRMPQFRFARSHKKAGESDADFEARMNVEEAEAREAVMTFVLGLVAEPVPVKSINQPKGDRLAEVKGRQVIDKYNCAGCHVIRPGVFDFKLTPEGKDLLDETYQKGIASWDDVHKFPKSYNWSGKNPDSPDRLTAQGFFNVKYNAKDDKIVDKPYLRLAHALRFPSAETGGLRDVPSSELIQVPVENMIYPPASAFSSEETLTRFLRDKGTFGGDFANLLQKYLAEKGPSSRFGTLNSSTGESDNALSSGPPFLIGAGERIQTAWLTQFLLEPYQFRKMTVLRMPKFNMSHDEAEALVKYFSAVSRTENTGTEVDFIELIKQQESFDSKFWKEKNAAYIERLKNTPVPGSKDKKSLFDLRKEEYRPYWEGKLDGRLEASEKLLVAARKSLQDAMDDPANKKNDVFEKYVLPGLKNAVTAAEENKAGWEKEKSDLERELKPLSTEKRKKYEEEQMTEWMEKYAYVTDSFKLATNVCASCHQVGSIQASNPAAGPPLANLHQRLRPGWTERWIAAPKRLVHYTIMPSNFPPAASGYQELFPGTSLEQVTSVRDVVLAYPRIEPLALNRYWVLSLPILKAEEEQRKAEAAKKKQ